MRTQDVISVMPSQYSFEGGSQSHAGDFGREFLPLQSGGSRRLTPPVLFLQSEKNFRANTYNDALRPTRGTSAGLRGPHTRSDWQNHTQNRGNLKWGSMEQTRQPRSWAEGERYARPFIKLPAFTGKEEWKVWINCFEAVDSRKGWTQDEKLDELLLRIQGGAGEFVYSQLPSTILNDYSCLVSELNSRYRVMETSRTFAVKFSNRSQRSGETAEEYAAELKGYTIRLVVTEIKERAKKIWSEDFWTVCKMKPPDFKLNLTRNPKILMRQFTMW